MAFQPKTTRNMPIVEHIGFIPQSRGGGYTPQGTMGHLSRRVLEITYYRTGALVWQFGGEFKESKICSVSESSQVVWAILIR